MPSRRIFIPGARRNSGFPLLACTLALLPVALFSQSDSEDPSGTASPGGPVPPRDVKISAASEDSPSDTSPEARELQSMPTSMSAGSSSGATSSIGAPGFLNVPGPVRSPVPATYPLQWGPFAARPHLNYAFTYADGVLFRPGQPTSTALHAVSPGLSIESAHLAIDYTPTLNYYSKGPYDDTLNHSASLAANYGYGDWSFRLQHSFLQGSYPTIETGTQTEVENNNTTFRAIWNFNEKIFFDFDLLQQFQENQGFQSHHQWSTMDWINYRLTKQLSIGGGVGGGFAQVNQGSDMTFEQFQGRLSWIPSKRLSLNLNGGIEVRQFIDTPSSGSLINPIMGASANYQLFDHTSLFMTANRTVDSSYFANQLSETTTISGGVNQRLLQYLNFAVAAGYRNSNYRFTATALNQLFQTARQDDYKFVSTTLATRFFKKGTASVSYLHGMNTSSLQGYTYDTDQFTVQLGYRF